MGTVLENERPLNSPCCRKIMAENQPARVRPKTKAKNKNAAFPKEGGVLFDHDT